MIAYSIVVLIAWFGSILIPFTLVPTEKRSESKRSKDTHFLRG